MGVGCRPALEAGWVSLAVAVLTIAERSNSAYYFGVPGALKPYWQDSASLHHFQTANASQQAIYLFTTLESRYS